MIVDKLNSISEGYSVGIYSCRKYAISKETFNGGKSIKLYAEELGGKDFISMNFYSTASGNHLKPCEMPIKKVRDFLSNVILLNE